MQRKGLEPGLITYSTAISACEKGKQPDKALKLLEDMLRKGLKPDMITQSAATTVCEKGKHHTMNAWRFLEDEEGDSFCQQG